MRRREAKTATHNIALFFVMGLPVRIVVASKMGGRGGNLLLPSAWPLLLCSFSLLAFLPSAENNPKNLPVGIAFWSKISSTFR